MTSLYNTLYGGAGPWCADDDVIPCGGFLAVSLPPPLRGVAFPTVDGVAPVRTRHLARLDSLVNDRSRGLVRTR